MEVYHLAPQGGIPCCPLNSVATCEPFGDSDIVPWKSTSNFSVSFRDVMGITSSLLYKHLHMLYQASTLSAESLFQSHVALYCIVRIVFLLVCIPTLQLVASSPGITFTYHWFDTVLKIFARDVIRRRHRGIIRPWNLAEFKLAILCGIFSRLSVFAFACRTHLRSFESGFSKFNPRILSTSTLYVFMHSRVSCRHSISASSLTPFRAMHSRVSSKHFVSLRVEIHPSRVSSKPTERVSPLFFTFSDVFSFLCVLRRLRSPTSFSGS
jgi:hypothetical protein